jgi:hypothetical protein
VTVPTLGAHTVLVDGSRLNWALPSPVHEGLGYRGLPNEGILPDRIQGDAVLPHASFTAQSRITFCRQSCDPTSRPSSLAPYSRPSRRGLPSFRLVQRAEPRPALTVTARGAPPQWRSGRRNASVEQRNIPPPKVSKKARGVRSATCFQLDEPHTRVGKGCARMLARSTGVSPVWVRPSKPPGSECCASPTVTAAAKRTQLSRGVCD